MVDLSQRASLAEGARRKVACASGASVHSIGARLRHGPTGRGGLCPNRSGVWGGADVQQDLLRELGH